MEEKILKGKKVAELKEIARTFGIDGYDAMKKSELIEALMATENKGEEPVETTVVNEDRGVEPNESQKNGQRSVVPDKADRTEMEGFLEVNQDGFGFLRFDNFETSDKDIYVSPVQIRRFNLKTGDRVRGITRKPREGEKFGALLYVVTVNDDEPGVAIRRPDFDDLTPIYPNERLTLEDNPRELSMRLIDLLHRLVKVSED